jgi:hypothetical protein
MVQKTPGQAWAPEDHFRLTFFDQKGRLGRYGAFVPPLSVSHSMSLSAANATVASLTESPAPQVFHPPLFFHTPFLMAPVRVTFRLRRDAEY